MKFFRNVVESVGIDDALVEFGVQASDTLLEGSIFGFEVTRLEIICYYGEESFEELSENIKAEEVLCC